MKKKFSDKNATIAYHKSGSGPVVLLLHGFAEDSHIWDSQISALQKHATVIAPDLPGSGQSTFANENDSKGFSSDKSATIEFYADCINDLLICENISKCIIFGHSMGGYIALAFAEKYPEKLQAFGLVNSTAFVDSEEKKKNRRKAIKLIQEYGVWSFIKNTTPNLFSETFKKKYPGRVQELIEKGKKFHSETLQKYYLAMLNRTDKTNVFSTGKPVLFFIGEDDIAAPLNDLIQQVYLPEIAYIHILKNIGHMGMWEAGRKLNKCLVDFVNDVSEFQRQ